MTYRRLIGAALALATATFGASPAAASDAYRPLVIDGQQVTWEPNARRGQVFLRYSVADREITAPETAVNCGRVRPPRHLLEGSAIAPSEFRAALTRAFARWEAVAAVTFVEVPPGSEAEIVVGEQAEPTGFAFTSLRLGPRTAGTTRPIAAATICLNPEKRWKVGFDGNLTVYDLEHTLAHEIGHAIGLDHPSPRGHLMSFRYTETIATLTAGDAKGAASIYGLPRAAAARDTTPALAIRTTAGATTVSRALSGPR